MTDQSKVDEIMALAERMVDSKNYVEAYIEARAALRAAVERIVRDKTQAEAAAEWNRELYEAAKARADLDAATAKLLEKTRPAPMADCPVYCKTAVDLKERAERAEAEAAALLSELKGAANYIDALGGDSKKYRVAIDAALQKGEPT